MASEPVDSNTIHQEILDRLDPEYRVYVESQPPASRVPFHTFQWSPAFRQVSPDFGQALPVPVGSTCAINLGKFSVLVLTPGGERPSEGWPALLFLHGGGWVLGTAETGIEFFSRACAGVFVCSVPKVGSIDFGAGARCVVVSVDYRLAPEDIFPAAVDDSWNALLWLSANGKSELGVDTSRIAIMGISSGANLAAVVAQRASLSSPRISLMLQILLIPILNLTYDASNRELWPPSMKDHNPIFFSPSRGPVLVSGLARTSVDASPPLQTDQAAFDGMAPTWVGVAELSAVRSDGEIYAKKLEEFGVPVTLKTYKGATHMLIAADRICELARTIRNDQIEALKAAFAK
ncbi:hypothetical protein BDV93DRAFT_511484 [Ceratobasidium sp. AG-I]|nr:hypothetical protein BDV93DRAFT_511484 [Ceratobasidium sp. AG-I]